MSRKIIHCDCDCFFAAVEMREDPTLRELPVAVGGRAERRGVVATCNYAARAYGVRSAMPTARAQRLCPSLVVIPPNMALYRQVAQAIRDIFFDFTEQIEPLSLDEAFLDVSGTEHCRGSATLIAEAIRRRVHEEIGITISAGVAPNKFLAKIASDWRKPDGLFVIRPDEVADFVSRLPVDRLHGVGKVTAEKLAAMGVRTCDDLLRYSPLELVERFGVFGRRLHELAQGIDERPVHVQRERKSLSVEQTYAQDLPDLDACLAQLPDLMEKLVARLRRADADHAIVKQLVKVKFDNFQTTTIERGSRRPRLAVFEQLCREAYQRQSRPVRLLGVGVRFAPPADGAGRQLVLFEPAREPDRQ